MMLSLIALIALAVGIALGQVISTLENSEAGVIAEVLQVPSGMTEPEFIEVLIAQEEVLPFTRFVGGGVDGPTPTVSTSFATRKYEVVIYSRLETPPREPSRVCRVQSRSDRAIGPAEVRATRWCYAQLRSSPIIPKPLVIR